MKNKIESYDIDLIDGILNIWNYRLTITTITVIFIVLSTIISFILKPPLTAKTEILPISIFENNYYSNYNLLIKYINENENKNANENEDENENENENKNENEILYLDQINKKYLFNFFIEELQTKEIIKEAIENYQLINKKEFDNEEKYLEAIENYALTLELIRPSKVRNRRSEPRLNWTIELKIDDPKKWEEALGFVENKINKNIQKYLKLNFNTTINNLKLFKKFKIEDLEQRIKNVKNDYEIETGNWLSFLREQAAIARELNVEKNTLDVESFITPTGVISNLQTAKPYYMRGYSVIEKEIELIETRTNKDAFNKKLLDLKKQKRDLLEEKSLERIQILFNNTPIVSGNNFKAAQIIIKETEYNTSYSLIKTILFAGIFGFIFGIFYVLISNAIKQRK